MWKRNKRLAAFLAVTTSLQVVAPLPVVYARVETKNQVSQVQQGSITTNIQFDYPITYSKVKTQNIKVSLLKESKDSEESTQELEVSLGEQVIIKDNYNTYTVEVVAKDKEGFILSNVSLKNEVNIGSYTIKIQGVEPGTNYTLKYTGNGYTTYEAEGITLEKHSKEVTVHTGRNTFSYGDMNEDGEVDFDDLEKYKEFMQSGSPLQESIQDLNGDGKVDIVDLTYVKLQTVATGDEIRRDTTPIFSNQIIESVNQGIEAAGLVTENGQVGDLLTGSNEQAITIRKQNASADEPFEIPINLGDKVDTQVVEIVSPVKEGGLQSGIIRVEYEGGEKEVAFDNTQSTYITRNNQSNSIVIDLGKRVPVKKVTIVVNKVVSPEGKTDFVVLEEVKFIKDILPDGPIRDESIINNLQATAGDKEVTLTWRAVNNVEGYRVYYGTEPGKYTQQLNVTEPKAVVSGLENLKTYYFVVKAVSGDWTGTGSEEISATPQPSEAPGSPDMLNIEVMDRGLRFSWQKTEDATYYRVFYKKATEEAYKQYIPEGTTEGKITNTSVSIGSLENDVKYQLYVIAGNKIGESSPSETVTGIPKKVEVEGPTLPSKNRIPVTEIKDVAMTDSSNVAKEYYPNGFNTKYDITSTQDGVKNVVDNDYATHWTAPGYHKSREFKVTFNSPKEMDYVVYVGRIDGRFQESLNHYNIRIWEEDDDLNGPGKKVVSNHLIKRLSDSQGRQYAVLEFPKHTVKQIGVEVGQWAGSPTNISASEIAFYEYDSLDDDIQALFVDDSFTQLASDVTQEKINELKARLTSEDSYYVSYKVFEDELNLAQALFDKKEDALGLIKDEFVSIDVAGEAKVSSTWSPLGIVAGPSTEMTIYADIPADETLEIIPTQYYAEAGKFQGSPIQLTPGRNVIQIPQIDNLDATKGGALYYRYTGDNEDKIKLQIRDLTTKQENKVRAIPTLELYNWYDLKDEQTQDKVIKDKIGAYIDALTTYVEDYKLGNETNKPTTNPYNSTEISGRNVLLSLPADQVLKGLMEGNLTREEQIDRLYNALLAWEEVISVVHTTYGLDNPSHVLSSRQNIRYMRMFGKAFMYAAVNHIGVGYESVSPLVQGEPTSETTLETKEDTNKLFGWGIAHEIGHNMDRIGKAEITNNIYSLMLQTYDGEDNILQSRLELSNKYEDIYKKVAVGDKGLANDVFTQLGMYWQLHLAYDDGKGDTNGPLSFYNKLFKLYGSDELKAFTGDNKFAVAASKVAGKDLTEFFTVWGMDLSNEAKNEMAQAKEGKEERKIQYLTDESRRQRLVKAAGVKTINFTAKAEVVSSQAKSVADKTVEITVQPDAKVDAKDLLGYEIFKNGKQIAFVASTAEKISFEDYIGSANNKVFHYQVRAIDILGNVVKPLGDELQIEDNKVSAGYVRVEHDNEIERDQYDIKFIEGDSTNGVTTPSAINVTTGSAIMIEFKDTTAVTGIKVGATLQALGNFTVEVGTKDGKGGYIYRVAKQGDFGKNDAQSDSKFINYFNKPGVASSDTRIWTYDADVIRITGEDITQSFFSDYKEKIMPLAYPGDNVALEDYKMAIMAHDYGEDEDGGALLKQGTLVIVGSYRGNPIHNIVHIEGKFMEKTGLDEIKIVERPLNGIFYPFAEVPEDGETSAISDGIFIFVPDIQKEADLQGHEDCSVTSVLPTEIMARMYYVDDPTSEKPSRKVTSETLWYTTPSYDTLPKLSLQNSELSFIQDTMYENK